MLLRLAKCCVSEPKHSSQKQDVCVQTDRILDSSNQHARLLINTWICRVELRLWGLGTFTMQRPVFLCLGLFFFGQCSVNWIRLDDEIKVKVFSIRNLKLTNFLKCVG